MAHVLVTGGAGRLGRAICDRLGGEHEITVFDLLPPKDTRLRSVVGDTSNEALLAKAMDGVDTVIHLAAIPIYTGDDVAVMQANVQGTFAVLHGAAKAGVRRFIGASSICAKGFIFWSRPNPMAYLPVDEDHPARPDDAYGLSKVFMEDWSYAYARRYGGQAICLRMATVWDPFADPERQQRLMAPLHDAAAGYKFIWNYVDLRDVADAFALALRRFDAMTDPLEAFHIGAAETASQVPTLELVRQYFPEVALLKGRRIYTEPFAPLWAIDRARDVLGYAPRHSWREYVR